MRVSTVKGAYTSAQMPSISAGMCEELNMHWHPGLPYWLSVSLSARRHWSRYVFIWEWGLMVKLWRCWWHRAEQRRAQQEKQRQRKGGQEVQQRRGRRIRAGAGKRRAADDGAAAPAAPSERKPPRRRVWPPLIASIPKHCSCFKLPQLLYLFQPACDWSLHVKLLQGIGLCTSVRDITGKASRPRRATLPNPDSCTAHGRSTIPLCARSCVVAAYYYFAGDRAMRLMHWDRRRRKA